MRAFIIGLLRFYKRWISPCLPSACRLSPPARNICVKPLSGTGLRGECGWAQAAVRCHPFHAGGYDPVPLPEQNRDRQGAESGSESLG